MADVAAVNSGSVVASPKLKKSPKKAAAKVTKKPSHPGTKDMVVAAVTNLKERNGSSLAAIKKYISANYKVDAEKLAPFVRKAVKSALASGLLVQSKGNGASGSFKIPSADKPEKKTVAAKGKKAVVKSAKPAAKKLVKKASPKKVITPKKVAKPKVMKSPAKAKPAPKSPVKKIAKRSPTKKPKSPKPKKAAGRPKAGAKKALKK